MENARKIPTAIHQPTPKEASYNSNGRIWRNCDYHSRNDQRTQGYSGASTNFISEAYVKRYGIPKRTTDRWQTVQNFEGEITIEGYAKQATVTLQSGEYEESITMDVSPFERRDFDALLGMTWLREHNPVIDWKNETVSIDLKMLQTTTLGVKPNQQTKVDLAEEINEMGRQTEVRMKPKEIYEKELKEVLEKLPKKYHEFIELFVKKDYRLPTHPPEYEVTIKLKPGAELRQVKQRQKSPQELQTEKQFTTEFYIARYI